jgi:hypothetical protein
MFACHHSLALPREFQSYYTLLLCSEHVQELVLCGTPFCGNFIIISVDEKQSSNTELSVSRGVCLFCITFHPK